MSFIYIKKHPDIIVGSLFLLFVFWQLIIPPFQSTDIWFDVKLGEIFSRLGIIHYDVFAYTTKGREFFPYEWLYQITVYYWQQLFGFDSIKYLIAFAGTVLISGMYFILRRIFSVNLIFSIVCCFVFLVSLFVFFEPRPYVIAYTFLVWNLFFILQYFFKGKNYLWITLFLTILWANIHSSVILDVALFAGYTVVSLLNLVLFKNAKWFHRAKILGMYTLATALLTVLPPLGIINYRLLWLFFIYRGALTQFILEWNPANQAHFNVTVIVNIFVLASFLFLSVRKKRLLHMLWVLPLLPFMVSGYLTIRNLFFTWIAIILIAGWTVGHIHFEKLSLIFKGVTVLIVLALVVYYSFGLSAVKLPSFSMVPVNATNFIKAEHMQGNMFNDFTYGGYMLYHLYPQQKVFIDGLADLFLCCEIPDLINLYDEIHLPDNQFAVYLNALWNKYGISYAELPTAKATAERRIEDVLTNDPQWNLVFWDDNAEIFVRKDGKNTAVLNNFGTLAATPYSQMPFREGQSKQALDEYQRMIAFADSGKSRNELGYILAQQGKLDDAKFQFEKAILLNPTLPDVYMNLAEVFVKKGDYSKAADLYWEALNLTPDDSFIYLRLGQLYNVGLHDTQKARNIFQRALKQKFDEETNNKFQRLISSLH